MAEHFEVATKAVKDSAEAGNQMNEADNEEIYGLYKQATAGDINIDNPGGDGLALRKWNAWNAKKGMSQDDAKAAYVAAAKRILPANFTEALP